MSPDVIFYRLQYNGRQWLTGRYYRIKHHFDNSAVLAIVPKRVLLVMTGLIGDTVMSTPVLIEARRLWPEAHISVLANGTTYELLRSCPLVDSIKTTTASPFSIRGRPSVRSLKDWIRNADFDLAIILLGDQFASLLAELEIPVRVGVAKHFLSPCLTHTYEIGNARTWGPSERLNALRVLTNDVRNVSPHLWVANEARISARRILSQLGVQAEDSYLAIHPFGSSRQQWWPADRVCHLAGESWDYYRFKTLVIGGPELAGFVQFSGKHIVDLTGKINLQELLAVIDWAKMVVTTDSGPFHISGALGRPTIGLFRVRRPEHAQRYESAIVIFGKHAECTTQCQWDKCRSIPCEQLKDIDVPVVLRSFESVVCPR